MATRRENEPGKRGGSSTPFWVTRRGARIALVALHLAALVAVLAELMRPFLADAHAVERVHALDFLASYAAWGFASCVILVLLGLLLRRLVMRDDGYYDGDRR